jgi:ADP-ribose pyrophosphatase YjhB (NUDIX family)
LKFCSYCGSAVARRVPPGDTLQRHVCDQCGIVHYQNPLLVVGTIPEHEGKLLLCRRAIEPRYGYWTLPAGFMENDETLGQGALRETREEAGAKIELEAPFTLISVPRVNQVHVFYRARLMDLEFSPGEESLEVALFGEADIPWKDLAFRTVTLTLRHWFADRKKGSFGFHAEDILPT